jgi:hypothetical protein
MPHYPFRTRQNSIPSSAFSTFRTALFNVSTLKRRPSPSTSSLSSNSSCDRRGGSIQLTKFGTQSPDAVNKLLRLSDSNQTKTRMPHRPFHLNMSSSQSNTSIPNSASPSLSNLSTTTGLSSVAESTHQNNNNNHHNHHHHRNHHLTKMRDTNKLTSESSSLNFKQPTTHGNVIRSNTQLNESNREGGGDSGRGSLNSTDTFVADGSEKSTSTISDGFSSVRVRNRPPLPQSNSAARQDDAHVSKSMRNWLQRSQSQNEVNTNDGVEREEQTVDYDEHEQVTAV